jgi:hypothetical protein
VKKSFDAVGWMQKRRAEIDKEDHGLSWEEKAEKTRKLLLKDRLWLRLKNRMVESTAISIGPSKGHQEKFREKHPD